jgi:hypothetical protein
VARDFMKGGIEVGVGALGGVLDTIGAEQDAKNIAAAVAAGNKQNVMKQWGTYVNYVIPVVQFAAVGMDWVKSERNHAMMLTQAGQLLGAKLTRNFTMAPFGSKKNYTLSFSTTPSAWTRESGRPTPRDASAYAVVTPSEILV